MPVCHSGVLNQAATSDLFPRAVGRKIIVGGGGGGETCTNSPPPKIERVSIGNT